MALEIDFEWTVDAKGYRLDHGRIIGNGGPKRRWRLEKFPTLYLVFAKIEQTPEGLLDFVNKFGRLTLDKYGERVGDNVRSVLSDLNIISTMFEMLRGRVGNLPKWQGGPVEYEVPKYGIKVAGGIPLKGKLTAWLMPDPTTGAWQFRLQPPTLLDAIWLQFGSALTGGAALKECAHCRRLFEAGAGVGKRRDARFCSPECKINFHSQGRSR